MLFLELVPAGAVRRFSWRPSQRRLVLSARNHRFGHAGRVAVTLLTAAIEGTAQRHHWMPRLGITRFDLPLAQNLC